MAQIGTRPNRNRYTADGQTGKGTLAPLLRVAPPIRLRIQEDVAMIPRSFVFSSFALPLMLLMAGSTSASVDDLTYQMPSQALVDLVDTPLTPSLRLSPTRTHALLLDRQYLKSIDELAERELRLAGMRIKPQINAPSRTTPANGMRVLDLTTGRTHEIEGLPEKPRMENLSWAGDGDRALFTQTTAYGLELWVVDIGSRQATRLTEAIINLTAAAPPRWFEGGKSILCTMVPSDRGPEPQPRRAPLGPVVQENLGDKSPARTYQDLLGSPYDERLFEYFLTSQLVKVSLGGEITPIGEPGLVWDFSASPDGNFALVEWLHRPFSYLVPAGRFPTRVDIWNEKGELVEELVDMPLRESIPIARGSVQVGPRSHGWRADAPATLLWAETLDGGDAAVEVEFRDQLYLLEAPFSADPTPWIQTKYRYGGVTWGTGDLAMVSSWVWGSRTLQTVMAAPERPGDPPQLLHEWSWEDKYNEPGSPMTMPNEYGRSVMAIADDGISLFYRRAGASPEGERPQLRRFNMKSGEMTEVFRSEEPYYESVSTLLDNNATNVLTRRETATDPPNYYAVDLASGDHRQLTEFPHPSPKMKNIQKEIVHYERADGVKLSGKLYLPPGYDAERDGPLPMVMWAYPKEYKSKEAAGQTKGSPYQFKRVSWWSSLVWLNEGYAVLDDPSLPITGEGEEEPNDTYVEQLVAGAEAAVNEMVRRGVTEPGRVAIGGHSYGAFMTANLLAHSDIFAAGIARSGAYNRTLTPFGFQSEERTLWEATDIYFEMSPFMHADQVNEPLLLIHGEADNNSGTFPMQSERFYNALKGHGATARLVMLPHESHGYRSRESILHMMWETEQWLDRYVKNPQYIKTTAPAEAEKMGASQGE